MHRITQKLKFYPNNESKNFYEQFQNLLKEQISIINDAVDPSIPNYIYATNVLKSKNAIFKFFQDKLIWMIEKTDPELVGILKDVAFFLDDSQNSCYDLFYKLKGKIEEKFEIIKKHTDDTNKTSEEMIISMRNQLESTKREKDLLIKSYEEEKEILLEKIARLESENSLMTEKLIKSAKNSCDESYNNLPKKPQNGINSSGNKSVNMAIFNIEASTKNEEYNNKNVGKSIMVGPIGARILTKKMLLEIIDDIYNSKAAFDKRCIEYRMPRETLEQHMYTYLNQKYGLKNLIIEWAASIVNGIKMFSAEDPEVCLFGKILRNELEEDARIVILKLKSTISDLLSYYLKAKNPLKSNREINDIATSKQNSFILQDEWKGIINYLFENEEVKQLESKITNFIKKKFYDINKIEINVGNKKLTREELQNLAKIKEEYKIPYSDFVKCVLDFQIRLRDKYLKNFTSLFRSVDKDSNGIINEEEFLNLIALMNIYPKHTLADNSNLLLNNVDPFNNKQITYTECVNLFAEEFCHSLQPDETGNKYIKINVLDKVSMDEFCTNNYS